MKTAAKICVVDDIDNAFLKSEWERLETESDAFPQSTYHWCATWWKHLAGARELHVVMVLDQEGRAVGIAPLCSERHVGIRVLRSFPINYGDFHGTIVSAECNHNDLFEAVFDYLNRYDGWDAVLLAPINDRSPLFDFMRGKEVRSKHLAGNIVTDISSPNWDHYLGRLSRNRRRLTRKKMRLLEAKHQVEIELVTDEAGYVKYFDRIREIQGIRATKDRADRSNAYMECVKETNSRLLAKRQMILYLIKANDTVLAYRFGIVKDGTFYDWTTNFDIAWSEYSPGLISIAYVIRDLIGKGFTRLDFMAGVYDYKLSYSPKHEVRNNYLFVMGEGSLRSRLFVEYHLKWRDRIRPYYLKCKHVMSRPGGLRRKSRSAP